MICINLLMNIHISQTVGSVELKKDVIYQPLLHTFQATFDYYYYCRLR